MGCTFFYFIFVQFMQFPVLSFGLPHSGSQPFNYGTDYYVVHHNVQTYVSFYTRRALMAYTQKFGNHLKSISKLGG